MMSHEITALAGRHKQRKRRGRGAGSGLGKTSGRGTKGQGARAGSKQHPLTEGGQMPLFRRMPKRGFSNAQFTSRYAIVNVSQLELFHEGDTVDANSLCQAGLIRSNDQPVKILGTGEINRRLEVLANKFSRSAKQKITSAGGTAQEIKN
jgi:large subunit ribosomal protein L15